MRQYGEKPILNFNPYRDSDYSGLYDDGYYDYLYRTSEKRRKESKMAEFALDKNVKNILTKIHQASLNVNPEDYELTLNTIEELGGVNEAYDEIVKSAGCLLRVLIEAEEKQFLNKGLLASEEN